MSTSAVDGNGEEGDGLGGNLVESHSSGKLASCLSWNNQPTNAFTLPHTPCYKKSIPGLKQPVSEFFFVGHNSPRLSENF